MHFKYEDRNRLNIRVEKKAYAILTLVKKKKKKLQCLHQHQIKKISEPKVLSGMKNIIS